MTAPKVTVLRGVEASPADLATVHARIARDLVIDPELVRDATDEGYRTGYNSGFTAGLEDSGRRHRRARRAAPHGGRCGRAASRRGAADELDARHADVIAEIEERVVTVACQIAEALVGHELDMASAPGRDTIVRCLQLAPQDGTVVAHLHPDDVTTAMSGDGHEDTYGRAVRIVADATLAHGDAVVDVGPTRIDGRIAPAMARIREVLQSS